MLDPPITAASDRRSKLTHYAGVISKQEACDAYEVPEEERSEGALLGPSQLVHVFESSARP